MSEYMLHKKGTVYALLLSIIKRLSIDKLQVFNARIISNNQYKYLLLKLILKKTKKSIVDWLQKIFNILRQNLTLIVNLTNFDPFSAED
jgi:hypothetical protein